MPLCAPTRWVELKISCVTLCGRAPPLRCAEPFEAVTGMTQPTPFAASALRVLARVCKVPWWRMCSAMQQSR